MDGAATACNRRTPFDVELMEATDSHVAVRQQQGPLVWLARDTIWQDTGRQRELLGSGLVRLYLRAHSVEGSALIRVAPTKLEAERIALGLPAHEPILPVSQRIEGVRHTTQAPNGELDAMSLVSCHIVKVYGKSALINKRYELPNAPAFYKERWLPLSQIFARRVQGKDCEVFLPHWLANKHGLRNEAAWKAF